MPGYAPKTSDDVVTTQLESIRKIRDQAVEGKIPAARMGEVAKAMIKVVQDPTYHPEARRQAAITLGVIKAKEAVPVLTELAENAVKDKALYDLREDVMIALGRIGQTGNKEQDRETQNVLRQIAESPRTDVKGWANNALAAIGPIEEMVSSHVEEVMASTTLIKKSKTLAQAEK